jgi:hypothetical protein
MKRLIARAVADKASGERPSVPHALFVAAATGVAVAGVTYRVLRS